MKAFRLPKLPRSELERRFHWSIPERFNLAIDTVDRIAGHYPRRLALAEVDSQREVAFAELKENSDRLANVLRAMGTFPGSRVGIFMQQSVECALAHLAVYKLGAVAVPLSVLFGEDALAYRLQHSGAEFLIAERQALEPLRQAVPAGVRVIYGEDLLTLARGASSVFSAHPTLAEDPAILIYTSGTTGNPKGALLPHRVLLGHLPGFYLYSNLPNEGARYWSPADWAWIGGLLDVLLPAWFYGYTVLAYRERRFDPERALWLLERYRVTHTFLFPTALKLMRRMGNLPSGPLRLESVHSGGEPLGVELQEWSKENLGIPVNEFYGQTEANLLVGHSFTLDPIRPGSMGLPYPGHQVVLLDEEDQVLSPGRVGEVALKTPDPVAFLGYWNNPEATAAKFSGPYLRTGDLAEKDNDGYFWFKARKDDLIKSAGYRISPFEIEEVLLKHDAVAMAAVVGLPDPDRGQRVTAFVKLNPGFEASLEARQELQALVRHHVGHHAYPRDIRFVKELPLTTTGKIQRFKMRDESHNSGECVDGKTVGK
jgi:acetyl-CoA synthetase